MEDLGDLGIALERERRARRSAEVLLEKKSLEFARLHEALNQRNKELEQVAFIISHDLRQPANTIASLAGIVLKQKHLEETVKFSVQHIADSSRRMQSLISDLLAYARLGQDSKMELLDCNQILDEVRMDLANMIEQAGASVHSEKLPLLNGYRTEIRLVFQNLINNAIKFSRKDIPPQIHVESEDQETQWLLRVRDNGIGIPKNKLHHIFTIFHQAHHPSEFEGSGIGLAHCKKIVELHHGRIWATSEIDKGSTFHFTIQKNAKYETETKDNSAH